MIRVLHLATESTYYFGNIKLIAELVDYMSTACKEEHGEE